MRRFLLVLAMAVLVLARPVRSQDDGKDEGSQLMQSLVTLLRQELDLNDDQIGKVTTVLEKGMTHLFVNMLARQNGEDPDDDLVKDEIMDGLRGVVDDAQRKELDVLLHEFETQTGRFQ